MSYLFFNSISLAHMTNELYKAYHEGIQKMWVLNVGALKPLEMEMETFLDYAWDAGRDAPVTKDIHAYTVAWFDRHFSGGYGEELAGLYEEFAQLTNARKIEHMDSLLFAQSGYGDEAGERVCRLESVFERANAIYDRLPDREREAFFQLFFSHEYTHPLLIESHTYFESVVRRTLQGSFKAFSAIITAVSSIRLFVVSFSPPLSCFSFEL